MWRTVSALASLGRGFTQSVGSSTRSMMAPSLRSQHTIYFSAGRLFSQTTQSRLKDTPNRSSSSSSSSSSPFSSPSKNQHGVSSSSVVADVSKRNEELITSFFEALKGVKRMLASDFQKSDKDANEITDLYTRSKSLFVDASLALDSKLFLHRILLPFLETYGATQVITYLGEFSENPRLLGRIMAHYLSHTSSVAKTVDLFQTSSQDFSEENLFTMLKDWELTFRKLEGLKACSGHPKYSHILGQIVYHFSPEDTRLEVSKNVLQRLVLGPWLDEIPLRMLEVKQRDRFGPKNIDPVFFHPPASNAERFSLLIFYQHDHSSLLISSSSCSCF